MRLAVGGTFLEPDDVVVWARDLRRRFGSDPPRICRRLGIGLVHISDGRDDWDARLAYRDLAWLIVVNRNKPRVRREFAIAHELMHWAIIRNTLIDPPPRSPSGAALRPGRPRTPVRLTDRVPGSRETVPVFREVPPVRPRVGRGPGPSQPKKSTRSSPPREGTPIAEKGRGTTGAKREDSP